MATKEELQAAASMLMDNEKQLIIEIEELLNTFSDNITSLLENMPMDPAPMTPASNVLQRIKTSVPTQFMYELNNLKAQYGINPTTGEATPPAMPTPTS